MAVEILTNEQLFSCLPLSGAAHMVDALADPNLLGIPLPGFLFHPTPPSEGPDQANLFGWKIPDALFHEKTDGAIHLFTCPTSAARGLDSAGGGSQ